MSYAMSAQTGDEIQQLIQQLMAQLDPRGCSQLTKLVTLLDGEPAGSYREYRADPGEAPLGLPPITARQHGLATLMYKYLRENRRHAPLTHLADQMGIRQQTLQQFLKVLEAKGYVTHRGRGLWELTEVACDVMHRETQSEFFVRQAQSVLAERASKKKRYPDDPT